MLDGAAGTTHLLVVGDGRVRGAQVDHEPQVGLVEAHPQRRGGHQRLHAVVQQGLLELDPLLGVGAPGVGTHLVPRRAQRLGHVGGLGHREGVHDARTGQVPEVLGQPRQPVGRGELQHAQAQRVPPERAAQRDDLTPVVDLPVSVDRDGELLGDVGDHPRVGGGRGGQHRGPHRQGGQQVADASVVRSEVVAPVGHAVRLVHDQQADPLGQLGQPVLAEVGVVETLRAHQQDVDLARGQLLAHRGPLGDVAGVDGVGTDPGAGGGLDLVAHQRQQRADDDGGPRPDGAQQRGGHEVHRRLTPPGPLHHEHARAVDQQRLDGLELVLAEVRVRSGGEPAQHLTGVVGQRRGVDERVGGLGRGSSRHVVDARPCPGHRPGRRRQLWTTGPLSGLWARSAGLSAAPARPSPSRSRAGAGARRRPRGPARGHRPQPGTPPAAR